MAIVISEDAYLSHYGVKGMRWGVRRQRKLDSLKRVAEGTGSLNDKIGALNNVSLYKLAKHKGFRKAVGAEVKRQEEMKARLEAGEAKASDILRMIGTTRLIDLKPFDK